MRVERKILILTSSLERGGAESHIITLAKGLCKLGCYVSVASVGGKLVSELEDCGIKHYVLPLNSRSPLAILKCRRALKIILTEGDYTIVHAHSRIAAFAVSSVAKRLKIPFVTTVHAKFSTPWYFKRLSRWGNISLAVSEDLRHYLCETYKISPENTRVAVNGVDTERFHPQNTDIPKRRIVFASRLDRDCSHTAFLLLSLCGKIVESFPDVEILICGGGELYPELKYRTEKLECFRVLGDVEKMENVLMGASLFVGVSRAATEAMACGVLTILSGNEGYFGLVESEDDLDRAALSNFCCRGEDIPDSERLYSDICRALSLSQTERERVGGILCEYVQKNHSAEKMAKENIKAYDEAYAVKKERGVVLCGYYGFGNMGDNALLRASVARARKRYADKPLCALTRSPKKDQHEFNLRCVRRNSPFAVWRELRGASLLVFGGGTLLQENTSLRSLAYYCWVINCASQKGVAVELWGNGLGAPRSKLGAKLMKNALQKCRYVGLRDSTSVSVYKELMGNTDRVHREADLACKISPSPHGRIEYLLGILGINDKTAPNGYAVVTVKGSDGVGYRDILENWLEILSSDGIRLLLIPMFPKEDIKESRRLCRRFGGSLAEGIGESDAVGLIRGSRIVCGMRLHSLVFASAVGVPFVGFGGDTKNESFCRENGGLYFTDLY